MHRAWRVRAGHGHNGSNVLGCGAAAATNGVHQVLLAEGTDLLSHLHTLLVVATHGVGQASIGVAEHKAVSTRTQVGNVLLHVCRTQRAVEAHSQGLGVADAVPERLVGLARQRAPAVVHNGAADEHGDAHTLVCKELLQGVHCCLGVEGVKDGLHQEHVHTTSIQALQLLVVGVNHLVVGDATEGRVLHRRGHTQGLVGGAHCTSHKLERARVGSHVVSSGLLGQLSSRLVDQEHLQQQGMHAW